MSFPSPPSMMFLVGLLETSNGGACAERKVLVSKRKCRCSLLEFLTAHLDQLKSFSARPFISSANLDTSSTTSPSMVSSRRHPASRLFSTLSLFALFFAALFCVVPQGVKADGHEEYGTVIGQSRFFFPPHLLEGSRLTSSFVFTRSFLGIDLGTTYSCVGYVFELSFLELPSHTPITLSTPQKNSLLSLVLLADVYSHSLRHAAFSEPDE